MKLKYGFINFDIDMYERTIYFLHLGQEAPMHARVKGLWKKCSGNVERDKRRKIHVRSVHEN